MSDPPPDIRLISTSALGATAERGYRPQERAALSDALPALGETAFDVFLNDRAY